MNTIALAPDGPSGMTSVPVTRLLVSPKLSPPWAVLAGQRIDARSASTT